MRLVRALASTSFGAILGCASANTGALPALDAGAPAEAGDAADQPEASDAGACAPGAVPEAVRAALALAPFYAKYTDVLAFPIVSSSKVPDAALCTARDVIAHMFEQRPELASRLIDNKIRLAIMAASEVTTDIPEHAGLAPKDYWDARARGLGATLERPAASVGEENVLCHADDRYKGESILVHEFSHTIFTIAIAPYEPHTKARLDAAYNGAIAAGRFKDTYAATSADEYWAEGVQDWFDANLAKSPPDGIHNQVRTRAELLTYDPELAMIIAGVFGDRPWRYACP